MAARDLEAGAVEQIEIRRLGAPEVREQLDGLAAVLVDCVEGGASVGYMAPFSQEEARLVYEAYAEDVEHGRRLLLAAFSEGTLVGTVQVVFAAHPNQPHRADIARMLVHRSARRRGIAQRLMEQAEREALAEGKSLLVLDAVTGDDAERLYERLGWTRVGVIPNYALYPDGRFCDTTFFFKALSGDELERGVTSVS
ncbi:MAG: GNAT family N-acetyltransferase [Gaiellaceae bacterium]